MVVSGLTLFSGFGLGTLLMPAFALFFPIEVAVAATAVVHMANNVFKITVVGRNSDRDLVLRFGIPAVIAAILGAWALGYLSDIGELVRYGLGSRTAVITPLKVIMGILMLGFALFELVPALRTMEFDRRYLLLGGILSGFFGGFSGHQGALRSAFLAKVGISTQAFVGTNAVIGFMVDMVRIATYAVLFLGGTVSSSIGPEQLPLIVTGIVSAFAGVMIGKRFIHKVTMETIQTATGIMLTAIAVLFIAGLI